MASARAMRPISQPNSKWSSSDAHAIGVGKRDGEDADDEADPEDAPEQERSSCGLKKDFEAGEHWFRF